MIHVQDDLFKTAEQARDEAVARVDENHSGWIERFAMPAIERVGRGTTFTTDDLWRTIEVTPPEPRAMGAAMTRAKRQRLARPTMEHVASERAECHGRPIRVWERL